MNENLAISDYLEKQPEQMLTLLNKVRHYILHAGNDVSESFKYGRINFEHNGIFAFLKPAKDHISLVFVKGVEMQSGRKYEDMLEGTGAKMRHLKIFSDEQLSGKEVNSLVILAISLNQKN